MTGTCRTCRWWDNADDSVPICGSSMWRNEIYSNNWGNDSAGVAYGNNRTQLVCMPDFGCIHWEAKDDNS